MHIVQTVSPPNHCEENVKPWWMANSNGDFSASFAFTYLRQRKEKV